MQTTRLPNSMGYIKSDGQTDWQTDGRTDRQTDGQTDMTENITYPHTRVVKIYPSVEFRFNIIIVHFADHFETIWFNLSVDLTDAVDRSRIKLI